jgi:predicted amidohydrolase YtcJ
MMERQIQVKKNMLTSAVFMVGMLRMGTETATPNGAVLADKIYYGGDMVTMVGSRPQYVERLAVRDGKILFAGEAKKVGKFKGPATVAVNLRGRFLAPGFFDAHSHLVTVGVQAISANLLPQPDGTVNSISQLQNEMRKHLASSQVVKKFGVVIGFNYDDSQLKERRSPTAAELDAISTTMPVVVIHQSGHLGAMNSVALKLAGVTETSKNPQGGIIQRKPGTSIPNGVLEETAFFVALFKVLPDFSEADKLEQVLAAQKIYAANGFTTVQEGRAEPEMLSTLQAGATSKKFVIDVIGFPALDTNGEEPIKQSPLMSKYYTNRLRYGGVKLTFDGSPQGKTAYFTKHYFKVPEGQPSSYRGYPAFQAEVAQKWATTAYKNHWNLLVHANGDAAIDELISVVKSARAQFPPKGNRTVLIHGQFLRRDQILELKRLDIMPSLYPMHTFYWGDWHRESVAGPERAENISPTGWVLKAGMKFTIHTDAPVTFPNSIRVLDSAVNRTTRTGYVLGRSQRISPYVALQSMTSWAAFQHREDNQKGTLEVGKLADFVVLDRNPIKVPRSQLLSLKVVETIKEGVSIYSR